MIPYTNVSFTYVFNNISGNSLALQWLGLCAFTAGAQVQSLEGELRSRKPCDIAKNKKTNKISLMCSDLPMLLQERKSILVSFSFFPPNYHSESDQVYFTHGETELESSPEVLKRRKSTCNLGALEVKNPYLSCRSQQNQGKPLSQESFKAFFENLKVAFFKIS